MTNDRVQHSAASAPGEDKLDVEIYAKRKKLYPREVHGVFARLRVLGVLVLLGIFYGLPWLRWDDHQAVLFDLPARKFHIFAWTFWPQDFFFLALLLIIAALCLFFFTALAGRLWCGYACPQTVWTEVFLWIERKLEGNRQQQMALDKQSSNFRKFRIKVSKHGVWLIFSLFTGFTFVGYFTPLDVLWQHVLTFSTGPWETFWVIFYGFATYGNAGWLREQVCIYMCPYARFQSAMFDSDTLIISYDAARGEQRGSRKRQQDHKAAGLGDCIDCTLCVQVCPTGIDIRDGLQYQCIGCAACIDACDSVMAHMQYPQGLIRYTTENAMHRLPTRVLRPRVWIYAGLLLLLVIGFIYGLSQRLPLDLDVMRDRNALYRETDTGLIENVYTLRLLNMDSVAHKLRISVSGIEGLQLLMASDELSLASGEVLSVPARVQLDPMYLTANSQSIQFHLQALDEPDLQRDEEARFLGRVLR